MYGGRGGAGTEGCTVYGGRGEQSQMNIQCTESMRSVRWTKAIRSVRWTGGTEPDECTVHRFYEKCTVGGGLQEWTMDGWNRAERTYSERKNVIQ